MEPSMPAGETAGRDGTFASAAAAADALRAAGYLPGTAIASTVVLAGRLGKPVLVEGPAGTGKTELAKSVAVATGARLIRLQCYQDVRQCAGLQAGGEGGRA